MLRLTRLSTLSALLVALRVECQGGEPCTAAPGIWCSNDQIDESCDVRSQCSAYESSRRDKPVQLTMLVEAKCPDCYVYVMGQLSKLYSEAIVPLGGSLVHMELVPFGKAKYDEFGLMTCQHGQNECAFNKLESCVLHYLPMTEGGFDTVKCLYARIFELKSNDTLGSLTACQSAVPQLAPEIDDITDCYNGELGDELQKAAGARTTSVWPETLTEVPWIVLNGVSVHSLTKQHKWDLLKLVCDWYISDKKPDICG